MEREIIMQTYILISAIAFIYYFFKSRPFEGGTLGLLASLSASSILGVLWLPRLISAIAIKI